MDEQNSTVKVRSKKSEKEFVKDLTAPASVVVPDEKGMITFEGAFPQVKRNPVTDITVNGMTRITY